MSSQCQQCGKNGQKTLTLSLLRVQMMYSYLWAFVLLIKFTPSFSLSTFFTACQKANLKRKKKFEDYMKIEFGHKGVVFCSNVIFG